MLGVLVVTVVALELAIGVFHRPSPFERRVTAFAESEDPRPAVLLFGTCLVDDNLDLELVQQALGDELVLWNLSAEGTSPMDWLLAMEGLVPEDKNVHTVLLVHGEGDMNTFIAPWESQVMDLASWRQLPELLELTCSTSGCHIDVLLRKLSLTYRYRSFISHWAWSRLGLVPDTWLPQLPGGLPHPERFGGEQPCRRLDRRSIPESELASSEEEEADGLPLGEWAGDQADREVLRAPDLQERVMAATWSWRLGEHEEAFMQYPEGYLRRLVERTVARDRPVVAVPFPVRPPPGALSAEALVEPEVESAIVEPGGVSLGSPTVDGLTDVHFLDDLHVDREGGALLSTALGELLREQLVTGGAAADDSPSY